MNDFGQAFCFWLSTFAVIGILLVAFSGCATPGVPTHRDLTDYQRAVQNCILSGGHPHPGPDNTILCERE